MNIEQFQAVKSYLPGPDPPATKTAFNKKTANGPPESATGKATPAHMADLRDQVELSSADAAAMRDRAIINGIGQGNGIDHVDLSHNFSIDDVNRLLQTEIGRKVAAMFDEAGIAPEEVAGNDWSVEATAQRIFELNSGLFELYKSQNPHMTVAQLVDTFESIIRRSMDQGAQDAVGMLEERDFDSEVIKTADNTMNLAHEKFDSFFAQLRADLTSPDHDTEPSDAE